MEVTGKVKVVKDAVNVSDSFKKQELVVTTEEQYPQFISITFVQDKCELLNDLRIGDEVKVHINLRGREWINPQGETKYFNDIQGWRIEKLTAGSNIEVHEAQVFEPATNFNEEEHDDLPF
jgi:translation initiation factor IF-3